MHDIRGNLLFLPLPSLLLLLSFFFFFRRASIPPVQCHTLSPTIQIARPFLTKQRAAGPPFPPSPFPRVSNCGITRLARNKRRFPPLFPLFSSSPFAERQSDNADRGERYPLSRFLLFFPSPSRRDQRAAARRQARGTEPLRSGRSWCQNNRGVLPLSPSPSPPFPPLPFAAEALAQQKKKTQAELEIPLFPFFFLFFPL